MAQANPAKTQNFYIIPKIINGGVAGMIGVCCVFPLDLVKTRLQTQQVNALGEKAYRNLFDCFIKTFKNEGLFGMYRGSLINIILVTPEKALRLSSNDICRYYLTKPNGTLSVCSQFAAASVAGTIPFIVTTPMELLKIQMQDAGRVAGVDGKTGKPPKTIEIIKKVYNVGGGIKGFYKGGRATILRDLPFSLIYFPLFGTINAYGPRKPDGSGEAQPWVSFAAGIISGATSAVAVTPADVVKTRLQSLEKATGEKEFSGIFDCFQKTLRSEGPKALFKGGLCRALVIAPLYGIANTIYFLSIGEYLYGVKKIN